MKKNLVKIFTTSAFLCCCLAACGGTQGGSNQGGSSSGDELINLTFWNGFTGKDGDAMRKIINDFNVENKGKIKVKADFILWDQLFLKLIQNKGDAAHSPNVVVIPANRISLVRRQGIIAPLNDLVNSLGVNEADYIPCAWDVGVLDDTRWSFPLDVHPSLLYYNTDLVSSSELPKTWEEFGDVCKAKTEGRVYGWAIPNLYSVTLDVFMNMLIQQGGDLFEETKGDNGTVYTPVFNNQTCVDILNQLRTWKFEDKISPASVGAAGDLTLFNSGKSAFYFDGVYQMNALEETSPIEWGAAQMPGTYGTDGAGYAGSHQWAVIDSTNQDENVKNATYKFIKYVSEHSVNWALGGQVPAYKGVHNDSQITSNPTLSAAVQQAYVSKMGSMKYDYYYEAYNFVGAAVANTLGNQTPAKTALDTAFAQFAQFLKENA